MIDQLTTQRLSQYRLTERVQHGLRIALLLVIPCSIASTLVSANSVETRRDVREAHFGHALYYHYQNKPYDALTTFLGNPRLELHATGSMNVLLSDLYARYGLIRESDAALNRARGTDVLSNHRNSTWLRYGKLLYQNQQNSLALNLLRQPPQLLTPAQDSERTIMVANILLREGRTDDAVELLQSFQTTSPFFRVMARYNLALALLRPESRPQQPLTEAQIAQRRTLALEILEALLKNQEPKIPVIVQPRPSDEPSKSMLAELNPFSKPAGRDLNAPVRLRYLEATNTGTDLEFESISEQERLNLRDKIALSLAYLRLTYQQSEFARETLRHIRLDSPYSNQALLTSAHVFYQLGDYQRSYNFATELSRRHPADPLVQEGWLLSARALEEQDSPQARERYSEASRLYKAQSARLNDLRTQLEQTDILQFFPTGTADPVLLSQPVLPRGDIGGVWAQLLDQVDIFSILQQRRQTHLLSQRVQQYQQRLVTLEAQRNINTEDQQRLADIRQQYDRVKKQFEDADQQDRIALNTRIQAQLEQRQEYLTRYLTEALLGLQRLDQSASKDR
ncbi:MAG: hypothetical protein VXW65_05145 [Pseudomonadota bacterium]|nr:hypothetical protein [Pseudomonadota bacterium]